MNNLARTYAALGRHADALKLAQQTVTLTKAKLGPTNRQTLDSMDSLASVYHAGGHDREAVKLYEETLPLMRDKLGPSHPMTLSTMHDLAGVYADLGRLDEAVKLYEDTLTGRQVKLVAGHPDTLASMDALARLLVTCSDTKIRNASRAVELAEKAVELAPNAGHFWNTLGVAHYRSGDASARGIRKRYRPKCSGSRSSITFMTIRAGRDWCGNRTIGGSRQRHSTCRTAGWLPMWRSRLSPGEVAA
jgi:tetratricopeptide (TPR) repeat protein